MIENPQFMKKFFSMVGTPSIEKEEASPLETTMTTPVKRELAPRRVQTEKKQQLNSNSDYDPWEVNLIRDKKEESNQLHKLRNCGFESSPSSIHSDMFKTPTKQQSELESQFEQEATI